MIIRALKPVDYESVHKLMYRLHALHVAHMPDVFGETEQALPEKEFAEYLRGEEVLSFVAEEGDAILGVCLAQMKAHQPPDPRWKERRVVYVNSLYVLEEYREQGLGKALMDALKAKASALELDGIELEVVEFPSNAKEFYQSQGFALKCYSMIYQEKKEEN